jgi:hypothetical protein
MVKGGGERRVAYRGSHIYVVWDPEANQLRDTSDVSINKEFRGLQNKPPPQSKPYEADKVNNILINEEFKPPQSQPFETDNANNSPPTQDLSNITPGDEFYRPAKGFAILKSTNSPLPEPKSYNEAIKGPESAQWLAAMQEEINTLKKKCCWDLIRKSDMPAGTRAISGRWVYKKKLNPDNSIHYKA